jgi:deoxyribose-phosphate aldolase
MVFVLPKKAFDKTEIVHKHDEDFVKKSTGKIF